MSECLLDEIQFFRTQSKSDLKGSTTTDFRQKTSIA